MKRNLIIEQYEFGTIEGINDEALLKAINKAQSRFFTKQDGFLYAEVLKEGDKWIKLTYWNSRDEAMGAQKAFLDHSSCLPFVQMISPGNVKILYLERILRYKSKAFGERRFS